jgi:hypothetical protein
VGSNDSARSYAGAERVAYKNLRTGKIVPGREGVLVHSEDGTELPGERGDWENGFMIGDRYVSQDDLDEFYWTNIQNDLDELGLGRDILGRPVIEGGTMLDPDGDEFRGQHVDDFGLEDEGGNSFRAHSANRRTKKGSVGLATAGYTDPGFGTGLYGRSEVDPEARLLHQVPPTSRSSKTFRRSEEPVSPEEYAARLDMLKRKFSKSEGISANGFEGLGGHGEGFETQNQGVTRRRPGEGPKANGGRPQSQEMDATDQPQYMDEREVAPGFFTYRPGEDPPPIQPQERPHPDAPVGHRRSTDDDTRPRPSSLARKMYPELFKDVPMDDEGFDPQLADFFENCMPNMSAKDTDGFERQPAQGITSGGSDVSDVKEHLSRVFVFRK